MANGSRRKRGDEYIFVDGRAVRSDSAMRDTAVPGQDRKANAPIGSSGRTTVAQALRQMNESDAFEPANDAFSGSIPREHTEALLAEERHKLHLKYGIFGAVLLVLALFSLLMSSQHPSQIKPIAETFSAIGAWVQLGFTFIFRNASYHAAYVEATQANAYFSDTVLQVQIVFKYLACGSLLAIAGMLYQNAFKNPIAAPSMLGVTNGINAALLVLVLQYGYEAYEHVDAYYIYSMIGGVLVLVLVLAGGKWISGKGKFNTVNMILMGTIVSQLLGVVMQYVQTNFMDEQQWDALYLLQNATGALGPWMFGTLAIGGLAALIPIFAFRFRLNLISFSDEETRLLGVDPTKLRVLALTCGSIMLLAAQLNSGQVAMISLIVPFLVRSVFGSEFRKQFAGNLLMGALVLLVCGDLSTFIIFDGMAVGLGPVVSIVAIPLFVWMMAIQQRTWE